MLARIAVGATLIVLVAPSFGQSNSKDREFPRVVARVEFHNQSGAIPSTTFFIPDHGGLFRARFYSFVGVQGVRGSWLFLRAAAANTARQSSPLPNRTQVESSGVGIIVLFQVPGSEMFVPWPITTSLIPSGTAVWLSSSTNTGELRVSIRLVIPEEGGRNAKISHCKMLPLASVPILKLQPMPFV